MVSTLFKNLFGKKLVTFKNIARIFYSIIYIYIYIYTSSPVDHVNGRAKYCSTLSIALFAE
jgi:hypothetical protein